MFFCSFLPATTAAGVVNTASLLPLIAPGSLISIYGVNLAAGDASASSAPLLGFRWEMISRRGNEIVAVCSAECRHAWETRGTP